MLRFGSGSYNVRESEYVCDSFRNSNRIVVCSVHLLDLSVEEFQLDRTARGQDLLDRVFAHLELVERDFFGLQFVDVPQDESQNNARWLEPFKSIRKQMQYPPYVLYFRVKFYVSDPSKLLEEYTRYHFYMQIRKDILEGKLICLESSSALLGSYAVQSEFGDYCPTEHGENYLNNYQFIPNQTTSLLRKIQELHKLHRGQTPSEAEYNFLDHAKRLEMYGVDIYSAKDAQGTAIQLGVSSYGLAVFTNGIKINCFSWSKIMKLSFKRKQFFVELRNCEETNTDTLVVFNVNGIQCCKSLWKSCIEHHTFFRLIAPPTVPTRSLFSLGSRYRFSGRTEYQSLEEMKRKLRIERTFTRTGSKTSFTRSSAGRSSMFNGDRTVSSVIVEVDEKPDTTPTTSPEVDPNRGSRRVIESEANNTTGGNDRPLMNGTVSPTATHRETTFGVESESDIHRWQSTPCSSSPSSTVCQISNGIVHRLDDTSTNRQFPSTSAVYRSMDGYRNGFVVNGLNNNNNNNNDRMNNNHPKTGSLSSPHTSPTSRLSSIGSRQNRQSLSNFSSEESLVVIRMRPDIQGRFGFNVKGGSDQNYPIIVSRVASDSSADRCYPKLNEGDQVLTINGKEVVGQTHDHIVRLIKAAREIDNGELVLTVRPNAYVGEEVDEPDFRYVPDSPHVSESVPKSDLLHQSLLLLKDAISSGAAILQFEQLYRKKPGMTMNDSRLVQNASKNRYRDVLPYDITRVSIQMGTSGDYINANFVKMEIPVSGIVNRYVAAQGPLPQTCADFWQVIWEQSCSTVIMLTTTEERGRVKCHQYWPRLFCTVDLGRRLQIICLRQRETRGTVFREFSVRDRLTREERRVGQMQYLAWPDHGVPDDPDHFISFVEQVRKARDGSVEPLLVHCSAGIGRTGVLILMETAAGLIEANQPVYPLDLVRTMRDQRAQLVQNSSQYKFVCEAVLKAYDDGLLKPLTEYQEPR